MRKEQRQIYKLLIDLPEDGYGLCNICRYAKWEGYDCESADLNCCCGIWAIEGNADDAWQGSDCWAFRPRWSLEDIIDMVGIFLQGEIPSMKNCKEFIPKRMCLASPSGGER